MQQIATSEKPVAASSLPISLGKEDVVFRTPDNIDEQNRFDQALAKAESLTGSGTVDEPDVQQATASEKTTSEKVTSMLVDNVTDKSGNKSEAEEGDSVEVEQFAPNVEFDPLTPKHEGVDWVAFVEWTQQAVSDIDKPVVDTLAKINDEQKQSETESESGTGIGALFSSKSEEENFITPVLETESAQTNEDLFSVEVDDDSEFVYVPVPEALLPNKGEYKDLASVERIESGKLKLTKEEWVALKDDDVISPVKPPIESLAKDILTIVSPIEAPVGELKGEGDLNDGDAKLIAIEDAELSLVRQILAPEPKVNEGVNESQSEAKTLLVSDTLVSVSAENEQGSSQSDEIQDLAIESPETSSLSENDAITDLLASQTAEVNYATKPIPIVVPQPVKSETNVNSKNNGNGQDQIVELNANQVDALVESIIKPLPDTPQVQALASQLRADINVAASELASQQEAGRNVGIDLKRIVDQSISATEPELPPEFALVLDQQVSRNERLIAFTQSIIDSAVSNPTVNTSGFAPANVLIENGTSSATQQEQGFVTAMDRLANEGATQASEQAKSNASSTSALDKPVPLHQPEGQKQLAEKIRWMVGSRVATADIRLDPPELGAMQIRVSMSGEQASVSFVVQSTQTRDMLAEAQPRLREMLSEQGIDLGESFVATQDQSGSGDGDGENASNGGQQGTEHDADDTQVSEQSLRPKQSPYNVDAYV